MAVLTAASPPWLLPRRPRRVAAGAVVVGVIVLHLGLAGFWQPAPPPRPGPAGQVALQVLRVEVVRPVAVDRAPSITAPAPVVPDRALQPTRPRVETVPALRVAATQPPAVAAATADEADADVTGPGADLAPPPLYPTRLPPPTQLRFAVQRGPLDGEAQFAWQHDGQRYALQFDARLSRGLPLIEQHSSGQLDDHGLAPERFTDRRRGRAVRAASFQREAGRILSGPRVEYPAWPGAQDRLGWIVQLAAIFNAAPAPPPEVSLFVVGARGGAGLWTFRLQGSDTVQTPLGPVPALYLRREPARAEDLRVEVWLDPARGHWPVRLRSTPVRGGEPLDLLLAAEPQRP